MLNNRPLTQEQIQEEIQRQTSVNEAVFEAAKAGRLYERLTCDLLYDQSASIYSAVMGAAWGGHENFVCTYLIPRGDAMGYPQVREFALLGAIWSGHKTLANALIKLGADLYKIIHDAIVTDSADSKAFLENLFKNIDINTPDQNEQTILGKTLSKYINDNHSRDINRKIILTLILNGADLLAYDVAKQLRRTDLSKDDPLYRLMDYLSFIDKLNNCDFKNNSFPHGEIFPYKAAVFIAELYRDLGETEAAQRWEEYASPENYLEKLFIKTNTIMSFEICYQNLIKLHDKLILGDSTYLSRLKLEDNKNTVLTPFMLFEACMKNIFAITEYTGNNYLISFSLDRTKTYLEKICDLAANNIFPVEADSVKARQDFLCTGFKEIINLFQMLSLSVSPHQEEFMLKKIPETCKHLAKLMSPDHLAACIPDVILAATHAYIDTKKIALVRILFSDIYVAVNLKTKLEILQKLRTTRLSDIREISDITIAATRNTINQNRAIRASSSLFSSVPVPSQLTLSPLPLTPARQPVRVFPLPSSANSSTTPHYGTATQSSLSRNALHRPPPPRPLATEDSQSALSSRNPAPGRSQFTKK